MAPPFSVAVFLDQPAGRAGPLDDRGAHIGPSGDSGDAWASIARPSALPVDLMDGEQAAIRTRSRARRSAPLPELASGQFEHGESPQAGMRIKDGAGRSARKLPGRRGQSATQSGHIAGIASEASKTAVLIAHFTSVWLGVSLERATGIEPAFSAWEADVLPLNYARAIWRSSAVSLA